MTKTIRNAYEENPIKLYNEYTSDAFIVQLFISGRNGSPKILVLFYPPPLTSQEIPQWEVRQYLKLNACSMKRI